MAEKEGREMGGGVEEKGGEKQEEKKFCLSPDEKEKSEKVKKRKERKPRDARALGRLVSLFFRISSTSPLAAVESAQLASMSAPASLI